MWLRNSRSHSQGLGQGLAGAPLHHPQKQALINEAINLPAALRTSNSLACLQKPATHPEHSKGKKIPQNHPVKFPSLPSPRPWQARRGSEGFGFLGSSLGAGGERGCEPPALGPCHHQSFWPEGELGRGNRNSESESSSDFMEVCPVL